MRNLNKILFWIILISLIVKLFLLPLFLDPVSGLPYFDTWVYLQGAKCILEGGVLYSGNTITDICYVSYGPLFPAVLAVALKFLGENYLLKLPTILFEILSVPVFYRIGKVLFGQKTSIFFTFVYAFSYLPLVEVMTGNDEPIFMFFVLLSTLFLVENRFMLSAAAIGIAAGFKVTPLLFLPVFLIAVYKKEGIKKAVWFALVFGLILSSILLPFYLESGRRVLSFYTGAVITKPIDGTPAYTSFISIITIVRISERMVMYLVDSSLSNQDAFVSFMNAKILPVLSIGGVVFAFLYLLSNHLKKVNLEFLRNLIMLTLAVLLTTPLTVPDYVYWVFPFLLLFFGCVYSGIYCHGKILRAEYLGAFLTVCGVFFYGLFFKYSYYELVINTYLVWFVFILSTLGAYLIFFRIPKHMRFLWAGLTLSLSMQGVLGTNPLLIFRPVVEKILPASLVAREVVVGSAGGGIVRSPFVVNFLYIPYLFALVLVFIASALLLVWRIHKLGNRYGKPVKWRIKDGLKSLKKRILPA